MSTEWPLQIYQQLCMLETVTQLLCCIQTVMKVTKKHCDMCATSKYDTLILRDTESCTEKEPSVKQPSCYK